jgi:hypothetical protein
VKPLWAALEVRSMTAPLHRRQRVGRRGGRETSCMSEDAGMLRMCECNAHSRAAFL